MQIHFTLNTILASKVTICDGKFQDTHSIEVSEDDLAPSMILCL